MSNIPSVSWSEATPLGSENISLGDDRIRELKTQVREVIAVDHEMALSGQTATTGQHKQVTLQEQANLGTGAVGTTILGNQTVAGQGELVYTDENNIDVQITSLGKINAPALGGVYPVSSLSILANIIPYIYPVGSIYCNYSSSTNPATTFGFGTWVAIGGFLAGIDGSTEFLTSGQTGGEKTHTLTINEMPAHTHTVTAQFNPGTGAAGSGNSGGNASLTTSSQGSGAAHNTLPPYTAIYIWRRSA